MKKYITITLSSPDGLSSIKTGDELLLRKDRNDFYDDEAIAVYDSTLRCGSVANSIGEVFRGTCSAGRIYDSFKEETACIVRFRNDETAIAELNDDQQ